MYPWATPGHLTHMFSNFIRKDEAFVDQWLVHQGLEKLAEIFLGMFSQF